VVYFSLVIAIGIWRTLMLTADCPHRRLQ
jgi:hypothetical protein